MKIRLYLVTTLIWVMAHGFLNNAALANSVPELEVQDWAVGHGQTLSFVVAPIDADGVVPGVFMQNAPAAATLKDNGDGTRTFNWQPSSEGEYSINFVVEDAQDPSLRNSYTSKIFVKGSSDSSPEHENITVDVGNDDQPSSGLLENNANTFFLGNKPGTVTKVLSGLPVSQSQTNVQQTSIDTGDGYLYTVNIEAGPNGDMSGYDLHTVLRQGRQNSDNAWEWKSVVVEDRTVHNKWHTAPSIAVDKVGHLHIAYNMHNFPWQYKRSDNAHDIYSLQFKGQSLTDAEIKRSAEQNRTNFPTLGTAEIPGNQITYPSFYKDRNRDLYVSYRFAAAPKRAFKDRFMSSGIAVYNTITSTWAPIGEHVSHSQGDFERHSAAPRSAVAFAGKRGWTSYFPKLNFDSQNNMLVSLVWREGVGGQMTKRPCILRTKNRADVTDLRGNSIEMPLKPDACGNLGIKNSQLFYSISSFALDTADTPYILLSPQGSERFITRYQLHDQNWVNEAVPGGATEIFFDDQNNLYAIASGIKIFKRSSGSNNWVNIYTDSSEKNCFPKVKIDASGKNAFIHTQSCDEKSVTIYGLSLP